MALQVVLPDAKTGWEKLEAWLRTPRGQLPMLLIFESTEDVIIDEDNLRVRLKALTSCIMSAKTF